jgi:hypothetical protein
MAAEAGVDGQLVGQLTGALVSSSRCWGLRGFSLKPLVLGVEGFQPKPLVLRVACGEGGWFGAPAGSSSCSSSMVQQ